MQEARGIQFVGERLANKIYEIVSSGRLRRLENVDKERERILQVFRNIHGVGQITANQFYAQVSYHLDLSGKPLRPDKIAYYRTVGFSLTARAEGC